MSPAAPVLGPLAAVAVEVDRWRGTAGWHVLYADLDLAERAATTRTLGLAPEADDLAIVRAALARWGADAPAHLGGQFAVAAWDGDRQRVVAFRDGVGLRALFWSSRPGRLVVGGDLRALLAAGVPDDLDLDMMVAVSLNYVFQPDLVGRTCFRAIDEVRGGDLLVWDGASARVQTWWDPLAVPAVPVRTLDEAGDALRAVLREVTAEAVRGGPIGVHLSSGIDSTTVAAFAAEALPDAPPAAFAWQWPPETPPQPEHARILAVAERWGLPLEWCPASLDDHVAAFDLDPTRDPTPMWALDEPVRRLAAARGVRVVLSGWGGDEGVSFNGRSRVSEHLLRRGQLGPLLAMVAADPRHAVRRLRSFRARHGALRQDRSLGAVRRAVLAGEYPAFVRDDVLRHATLPEPEPPPLAPREHIAWLLRRGHLGRRAGAWALAGEAHGLRYRYPLLDRRVLAVVMGLPLAVWLPHRRRTRWPLRMAGDGLVPDLARIQSHKGEPEWIRDVRRVLRQAAGRVAPLVATADPGPLGAILDLPAFEQGLAQWLAEGVDAPSTSPRGLHVLPYLPIETLSLEGDP